MIPLAALYAQLARYREYLYGGETYPSEVPGVAADLEEDGHQRRTNCCCFVEGLLVPVALSHDLDLKWTPHLHRQAMVRTSDLYGPVTALDEAGIAERDTSGAPPAPWSVVQAWHRLPGTRGHGDPGSGHTLIVEAYDAESDRVCILEANDSWGLDGVGRRGLGNLRDTSIALPEDWASRTDWTWARVCERYPWRAVCALRVQ